MSQVTARFEQQHRCALALLQRHSAHSLKVCLVLQRARLDEIKITADRADAFGLMATVAGGAHERFPDAALKIAELCEAITRPG